MIEMGLKNSAFLVSVIFYLCCLCDCENIQRTQEKTNGLSSQENLACDKLRDLMGDELYKDYMTKNYYLIRWLKDQNFDVQSAAKKLRNSLKWRKDNRIDGILNEDLSDIGRHCWFGVDGEDIHSRPLIVNTLGKCDLRKMMLSGNEERLYRFIYQGFERIDLKLRTNNNNLTGKNASTGVLLVDLNGFNLKQHACLRCLKLIPMVLQTYSNHYPAACEDIYFVNVPRAYYPIAEVMLPLLPDSLRKVMHIFGHDQTEWKAALGKTIRPDQLPTFLGGTRDARKSLKQ